MIRCRIKDLITVYEKSNLQASEGLDKGLYPFYTSSSILSKYCNTYLFNENSITMGTGGMASINYVDKKFATSTDCYNFTANKYTKFIYYYLLAQLQEINDIGFQGMGLKHLQKEYINTMKITIPDNYLNIVKVLDKKILEIDNVIEKTKETIEDYRKSKYAIIYDKISKGLNNSELKETGNIHINKIPQNWSAKKIKYIFEIKKNIAGKEGYDVLSITQNGIKIKDLSKNEGQVAANYSNYQIVEKDDFAMNHMDLLTGWVDISKYDGVTSPDYRVFSIIDKKENDSKYYLYLMQMCYMGRIFYDLGQGVSNLGRWRLQADKFLNFIVPNPPKIEQEQIANYLDKKCAEIDNLISSKQKIIDELEQYKKSLIYEYVTGKKEVI